MIGFTKAHAVSVDLDVFLLRFVFYPSTSQTLAVQPCRGQLTLSLVVHISVVLSELIASNYVLLISLILVSFGITVDPRDMASLLQRAKNNSS